MPFQLTWEPRGVYKRFTEFVSYPEYARSQALVLGDSRTDSLRYVINDFLSVEGYSVSLEQAEELASYSRGTSLSNPRLRLAYVTTDTEIMVMVKLVSAISSLAIEAFPTVAAARAWANSEHAMSYVSEDL